MNLTRRTFLGLAGALAATLSTVAARAPRHPSNATPSPDEPTLTGAALHTEDYSAIIGVL